MDFSSANVRAEMLMTHNPKLEGQALNMAWRNRWNVGLTAAGRALAQGGISGLADSQSDRPPSSTRLRPANRLGVHRNARHPACQRDSVIGAKFSQYQCSLAR